MKQMGCDTKDAVSLQQHKLLWKARAALVLPGPVTAGSALLMHLSEMSESSAQLTTALCSLSLLLFWVTHVAATALMWLKSHIYLKYKDVITAVQALLWLPPMIALAHLYNEPSTGRTLLFECTSSLVWVALLEVKWNLLMAIAVLQVPIYMVADFSAQLQRGDVVDAWQYAPRGACFALLAYSLPMMLHWLLVSRPYVLHKAAYQAFAPPPPRGSLTHRTFGAQAPGLVGGPCAPCDCDDSGAGLQAGAAKGAAAGSPSAVALAAQRASQWLGELRKVPLRVWAYWLALSSCAGLVAWRLFVQSANALAGDVPAAAASRSRLVSDAGATLMALVAAALLGNATPCGGYVALRQQLQLYRRSLAFLLPREQLQAAERRHLPPWGGPRSWRSPSAITAALLAAALPAVAAAAGLHVAHLLRVAGMAEAAGEAALAAVSAAAPHPAWALAGVAAAAALGFANRRLRSEAVSRQLLACSRVACELLPATPAGAAPSVGDSAAGVLPLAQAAMRRSLLSERERMVRRASPLPPPPAPLRCALARPCSEEEWPADNWKAAMSVYDTY